MEDLMHISVAIDGPAGAGKSTIAKNIAKIKNLIYLDTGAMYRACALKAINNNIDCNDSVLVTKMLETTNIDIQFENEVQQVYVDGNNVTHLIRTPEVSKGASDISAIHSVRNKMVEIQRNIAKDRNVILDGRDIGTFVLPDAGVKIFLTASVEERAKRRYIELSGKGMENVLFEEVLNDIKYRDHNDSTRDFAPLKKAEDAIEIDTTSKSIEEVEKEIIAIIEQKC